MRNNQRKASNALGAAVCASAARAYGASFLALTAGSAFNLSCHLRPRHVERRNVGEQTRYTIVSSRASSVAVLPGRRLALVGARAEIAMRVMETSTRRSNPAIASNHDIIISGRNLNQRAVARLRVMVAERARRR